MAPGGLWDYRAFMYFNDFYHRHPHGAPIGGLCLALLIVILVVVLTRDSKT
jgi:hypothetical protein